MGGVIHPKTPGRSACPNHAFASHAVCHFILSPNGCKFPGCSRSSSPGYMLAGARPNIDIPDAPGRLLCVGHGCFSAERVHIHPHRVGIAGSGARIFRAFPRGGHWCVRAGRGLADISPHRLVFSSTFVAKLVKHDSHCKPAAATWRHFLLMSWAGMRGVDSLAAALALPFVTSAGTPFPDRNLIVFITFGVILGTLVLQGLPLSAHSLVKDRRSPFP